MRTIGFWFLAWSLAFPVWGEVLQLRGHLDLEQIRPAIDRVIELEAAVPKEIILELSSRSGEISAVLDLAQKLYVFCSEHDIELTVYIDQTAVGAGAILPFVADQRVSSLVASWGAIEQEGYPVNLLRSQVRALIDPNKEHGEVLELLANAMIDPGAVVIEQAGKWKIVRPDQEQGVTIISQEGEELIVNQQQMQQLGVLAAVQTLQQFRNTLKVAPIEAALESKQPSIAQTFVPQQLQQAIRYDPAGPNVIGHLLIGKEGINQSTWIYVKQALDHYRDMDPKPVFIILELNSPGGEVFAAEQISKALVDIDTNHGIPVVAFIDNWALSAGALLAYSARFIAVAKDGAMGAAQPVLMGQGGMEPAGEKITSALRADFANRASFYGRNPEIAEAMVDADIVLVLRHDKIVRLQSEEQIQTGGPDPDVVISGNGKLLTLNAHQLIEYGVADFMVPVGPVALVSDAETKAGAWSAMKSPLWQYPFFQQIPDAVIDSYRVDWKVHFFSFLATPVVASILFFLMMLGFYIELNTPGFGIAGTVGLIALFFIILSSFAMQALGWLELIFLLVGLCLIALEIFILPGFGVAGIVGIILALIGLVSMLLPGLGAIDFSFESGTFNAAAQEVLVRLAWLAGAIVAGIIVMFFLSRYVLPKFSGFRRLVLTGGQEGYVAGLSRDQLPALGAKGVAVTPLRPGGKVQIADEIYDASSRGIFLDAGSEIIVSEYEGNRMIVQMVDEEPL